MTYLPVHPRTGLTALGIGKRGPIWPVRGGSQPAGEPAEPTETPPAQGATDGDPRPAEVDWKAKAREWERRAKDNKAAADKLAEIEQANKTAEEKAAERLAEAERRATEAEARALRRDIAVEHQLSKDDAALLDILTDEDSMRALAVRLAVKPAEPAKPPLGVRVPGEGHAPEKPGSLEAQIAAAQAEGNADKVMALKTQQVLAMGQAK